MKSVQTQIQNEYKTQIEDLEESLNRVGIFEADISKHIGGKAILNFFNVIFSYVALIIAVVSFVLAQFFFDDLIKFLSTYVEFSESFFNESSRAGVISPKELVIAFSYFTSIILLLVSALLKSLRVKNRLMIRIGLITSDLKDRILKMLGVAKDRQKTYAEHVARERSTFSS